MNSMEGIELVELATRNMSWMTGNLFLAWSAVLFALHLRGSARQRRIAGIILVASATVMLAARLAVRGTMFDQTLRSALLVAGVAAVAALWSWRAGAGDRWAHWVGYVGVLAFAPNAPYILSDLFHHVQDVRLGGSTLAASLLFSLQYGWFLVLGTAAWITLVYLGRDWLRRHRPGMAGWQALVPICAVMAFGIYLGRIERFHSWHPLGEPGRFLERVTGALTSAGPLLFTLVWWVVILLVTWGGIGLVDRARAAGASLASVGVWCAWTLVGALIVASPLVAPGYAIVGVDVVAPSVATAVACLLGGVALGALGAVRIAALLTPPSEPVSAGRRASRRGSGILIIAGLAAVLALPVAGGVLAGASLTQWYVQFRGLCEYGPSVNLHGDACVD